MSTWIPVIGLLLAGLGAGPDASTVDRIRVRAPGGGPSAEAEADVTGRASGTFEVKLTPRATDEGAEGTPLGRMSIEKRYRGGLEGTARGEMLTALTPKKESAGYVAVERVTGALEGRKGSFVLQHSGTMDRGAQRLTIAVVPDSGTGELAGLSGTMTIKIEGGKHFYELEYTLREER